MYKKYHNKEFQLLSEDESSEMYENTIKLCESYGLNQYEVSNFAKEGFECLHNVHYWKSRDFLGIGPGAHSRITNPNNERYSSIQILNPSDWIQDTGDGNKKIEQLSESDRLIELLMMGLRLNTGIRLII
jgi:oxygen-independent coproporphyrinogen III oxidase